MSRARKRRVRSPSPGEGHGQGHAQGHAQGSRVQGHAQGAAGSATLSDNAFLMSLFRLVNTPEGAEKVRELMEPALRVIKHVAIYAVCSNGNLLLQKVFQKTAGSGKRSRKVETYQAFGGCQAANNVLRMVNSLRLELMDESSLVPEPSWNSTFSPLFLKGDALLQFVVMDPAFADVSRLWIPESVREHMHVDMDAEVGLAQLTREDFSKARAQLVHQSIGSMAGYLFPFWRDCDGASFAALRPWIEQVLSGTALDDDVILLDGSSETSLTGKLAVRRILS